MVVEEETTHAIPVNPIAEGIARAVLQNFPHTLCFRCLAAEQGIKEHDARAAALVLIARDTFMIVRQVCHACQCTEETLVFEKPVEG
jgi:hypothetical protein